MDGLTKLDMKLQIITNGTLCDKENIAVLVASNLWTINFSFDGIRQPTYEYIRRKANCESTLERILATREAFQNRDTNFLLNSTIMRSNIDETMETIDFWDRHDFDVVRFLLMIVRAPDKDLIQESLYPVRDHAKQVFEAAARHVIEDRLKIVLLRPFFYDSDVSRRFPQNCDQLYVRSGNPQARFVPSLRELFQLGPHPLMPYHDCRAAFNTATILANGDVQMCYKYSVGNLHKNTFDEIWFGEAAHRIREKITGSPADCAACDCYRFGIAFARLDADRIENYFAAELAPYLDGIDFRTGVLHKAVPPPPPRLVGTEALYNIVHYANRYVGIPQAAGPLEVDKTDLLTIPGVVIDDSYSGIMSRLHGPKETRSKS